MRSRACPLIPRAAAVVLGLSLAGACDLDLANPNAATEETVVTTVDGVIAVAVGMQQVYAQSVEDFALVPALVTDEWGTQTRALVSYRSLLNGDSFDPGYGVVSAPWSGGYSTIKAANTLLVSAPRVGLAPGFEKGITALAKLFKAMALGTIVMQYDKVPVDVSTAAVFQDRAVVLDTILRLLESARADLAGVTNTELTGFRTRVLGTGFNPLRTIDAMRARYYLIDGQYQQAIDAADSVKLDTLSVFAYPSPTVNPVYNLAFGLLYVAGLKSWVDSAEAGDLRPTYWLNTASAPAGNPPDTLLYALRKYSGQNDPYPAYLPDEMKLIKAEAYTRLGQYATAAALVNAVRTQTTSPVDEPVAGLPALDPATQLATEAQLLAEIAKQRRYELFMQGLRWEDTRRLGNLLTTTPTFTWLPTPTQECRTNPNAVNCS
ncbi:MAG TPA: RagB/SusD family nutrient uptake outer membrane protein [Gemmatimonadales bacterium]|nr:RagB/SusD family nutrient uptake outer membrane protein [Gemmatimonadales bacterium]